MIDRAYLSINNICNLNCLYCNFKQTGRITNDEVLNEDDISCILRNILDYSHQKNISMFKIGIVGAGEPLLSFDKIKHIIEYTKLNDLDGILTFYIVTNGTIINDDMLKYFFIEKNRVTLTFSLDGYMELHNFGKDAFTQTIEGIKRYEAVFREKPVLNCIVSRKTLVNRKKVVSFYSEQGFEKVNFCRLVDVEDENLAISHHDFLDFLDFVIRTEKIVFRQNRKEKKYDCRTYGQLCGVGRTNIFITKQGIYPCCRFYKNDKYKLTECNAVLHQIEEEMRKKTGPVKDGECYYDKYILGDEQ